MKLINNFPCYKKGYLEVDNNHRLYYECCGNPNGKPVLFLHGGPGAGFSNEDKRFFNPEKLNVILFDQRGAGKSKPFASIENNTTQNLVEDINQLLDFLSIEKILLFGGSWGSTLALVYAIQFPKKVIGMLLRGIFLGTKAGIDQFIQGGTAKKYPKEWQRFQSLVPEVERHNMAAYYLKNMINGTPAIRKKYAYEWAFYEISIYKRGITKEEVHKIVMAMPYESLSIMEAHYSKNYCFLPDNYILDNTKVLENIPTILVQGKYDEICPPRFALQLHATLEKTDLFLVEAGHSDSEPEIETVLIREMEKFQ